MKKYLSHSYRKYLTLGVFSLISLTIGTLYVMASGGPLGYVYCSGEDSVCVLGGSTRVAYGADGQFEYRTLAAGTASIPCDNATFGDPIYGVVKACYRETVLARILLPWKNNGTDVEEKQPNGYLVTAGSNKEITVNYTTPSVLSECKKITATTKNVFVPTANQSEWNNFKTNAPNNNLGVTIGNCGTSTVVGYGWNVGTWGACNAECGTQTNQYRTVTCNEMTSLSPKVFGNVVSDVYCSAMAKPIDVQGCIGSNNCPVCNMNGIQDNGETGIDCGGPTCAACGQQQPTQTISGPSLQCIYFAPSMYYKINYYTQTNPNLGFIQDQIYNVAGIGNASFKGYGSLNTTASWAQPAENPPVAYVDSNCTMTNNPPTNSCASPPLFANIGTLTYNPTSSGQTWSYSTNGGSCTYTCVNGYSGDGCGTAPTPICYGFTYYQQPGNVDMDSPDYSDMNSCNVDRSKFPITSAGKTYNNPTTCRARTCGNGGTLPTATPVQCIYDASSPQGNLSRGYKGLALGNSYPVGTKGRDHMWCNCGGPVSPGALDDVDAELNEITCQPDGTWQRTWTTSVNYSCSYGGLGSPMHGQCP